MWYAEMSRLNTELDTLKNEYAIEQAGAVSLTITEVKFFLTQLRKGRADDISYRKTLINVFVNAIYLYDDKLVIFFNSGDKPVTIDDELLDQIENSAGFVFGALGSTNNICHTSVSQDCCGKQKHLLIGRCFCLQIYRDYLKKFLINYNFPFDFNFRIWCSLYRAEFGCCLRQL